MFRGVDTSYYPQPTFDSYLSMWDSARRVEQAAKSMPYGNELDLNVPFPRLWAFEPPGGYGSELAGLRVGLGALDPGRTEDSRSGVILVHTGWIQHQINLDGAGVAQDCVWGPQTQRALDAWIREYAAGGTYAPQAGHPDWVAVNRTLETALGRANAPGDPVWQLGQCRAAPRPPPPAPPPTPEPETRGTPGIAATVLLVGLTGALGYYLYNQDR